MCPTADGRHVHDVEQVSLHPTADVRYPTADVRYPTSAVTLKPILRPTADGRHVHVVEQVRNMHGVGQVMPETFF